MTESTPQKEKLEVNNSKQNEAETIKTEPVDDAKLALRKKL